MTAFEADIVNVLYPDETWSAQNGGGRRRWGDLYSG
jgi:hypothetical protein